MQSRKKGTGRGMKEGALHRASADGIFVPRLVDGTVIRVLCCNSTLV